MNINTILVPTDFSDATARTLEVAVDFARRFDARVVLIHAQRLEIPAIFAEEGTFTFPDGFQERVMAEAEAKVADAARDLAERESVDAVGLLVSERAEVAILDQAERLPADLIVMGTRGLSGLKHVMLGSIAERVVRLAPCPVMTVNAFETN